MKNILIDICNMPSDNTVLYMVIIFFGLALGAGIVYVLWKKYGNKIEGMRPEVNIHGGPLVFPGSDDLDDQEGGSFVRFDMGPQLVGPSRFGTWG